MVAFSSLFLNPAILNGVLRDAQSDVRAALICWGIVLSAFIVLRVPRKVLLSCLIIAAATVGLAATMVEMVPVQATASSAPRSQPSPASYRGAVQRSVVGKATPDNLQPH
jgi:hypothetical protein